MTKLTLDDFLLNSCLNNDYSFETLSDSEQQELLTDIAKEAIEFRNLVNTFISKCRCTYRMLPNKLMQYANTFDFSPFWIEDDGTYLGTDGYLDVYSDLFGISIYVDENGKFSISPTILINFTISEYTNYRCIELDIEEENPPSSQKESYEFDYKLTNPWD